MIDTVLLPLTGGVLIGLAAAALLLVNGRIAGISGIFGSALVSNPNQSGWRFSFISGLVVGGVGLWQFMPSAFPVSPTSLNQPLLLLAVAGLLVGFGTRMGSGCTSGHGVCGMARLSPRSFVATITFITTGAIAVLLTRLVGGYMPNLSAFLIGILFALGLGVGGMTMPEKVIGFLDFFGDWDPSLMFVMAGAVVVYFIAFRFIKGYAPVLSSEYLLPTKSQIDRKLVGGAAIFGFGWGLAGYCPGPGLTSLGAGSVDAGIFVVAMVVGMLANHVFMTRFLHLRAHQPRIR